MVAQLESNLRQREVSKQVIRMRQGISDPALYSCVLETEQRNILIVFSNMSIALS